LHLVDDTDTVFAYLHVLDQSAHNVPTRLPVCIVQSCLDALGKHLDVLDHNWHVGTFPFHFAGRLLFAFEFLQTRLKARDARLKVRFLEVAFLVGVDHASEASAYVADHLGQLLRGSSAFLVVTPQTAFIFRTHTLGLGQQGTHVLPDGSVQKIDSARLVAAHGRAPPVGIGTDAAIIPVVGRPSLTPFTAERFAAVGITALAAHQ
jgi:hypothetical protein